MLPRDGVLKTCKTLYGMLSKHFHRHNVRGNTAQLVIDTTPGHSHVSAAPDGAALEAYLQLGQIPYLAVCADKTVRLRVVGPRQPMVGHEMAPGYQRESWLDEIHVLPGIPVMAEGQESVAGYCFSHFVDCGRGIVDVEVSQSRNCRNVSHA